MAFTDWSGRFTAVGASANELSAISASYYSSPQNVQSALDTLIAGLDSGGLAAMLAAWRSGTAPFHAGFPAGGLPFGAAVPKLTGNPGDDTLAISAGTGQTLAGTGGAQGPTGPTGPTGPVGSTGATGSDIISAIDGGQAT